MLRGNPPRKLESVGQDLQIFALGIGNVAMVDDRRGKRVSAPDPHRSARAWSHTRNVQRPVPIARLMGPRAADRIDVEVETGAASRRPRLRDRLLFWHPIAGSESL